MIEAGEVLASGHRWGESLEVGGVSQGGRLHLYPESEELYGLAVCGACVCGPRAFEHRNKRPPRYLRCQGCTDALRRRRREAEIRISGAR